MKDKKSNIMGTKKEVNDIQVYEWFKRFPGYIRVPYRKSLMGGKLWFSIDEDKKANIMMNMMTDLEDIHNTVGLNKEEKEVYDEIGKDVYEWLEGFDFE